MTIRHFATFTALLVCFSVLAGCGGGSDGNRSGSVELRLTDAPMSGVEKVEVSISKIIFHTSGGSDQVLKEYATPIDVDLLQYRYDGTTESTYPLLSETPLSSGHYQWVRLELSAASVTVNGVKHDIDVSTLPSRGLQFNRQFTVSEDTKVGLLLDFNAAKSVKQSGSTYRLQPVTAMMPIVLAGSISGKVEFKDASGNAAAVPDGATVDAYKTGESTLVNSGLIASDGTFNIAALEAGIYDLKVSTDGYPEEVEKLAVVVKSGEKTTVETITMAPATQSSP